MIHTVKFIIKLMCTCLAIFVFFLVLLSSYKCHYCNKDHNCDSLCVFKINLNPTSNRESGKMLYAELWPLFLVWVDCD